MIPARASPATLGAPGGADLAAGLHPEHQRHQPEQSGPGAAGEHQRVIPVISDRWPCRWWAAEAGCG